MISPDHSSFGFLDSYPDPLRYENSSIDPEDVAVKLASLISGDGRVLDVGCGTGSVTEIIKRLSKASVIGIEPDSERRALATTRGLDVFEGYLSAEFLKQHGPFETIVFADVLEHLPNPGAMIHLAKSGLVPEGSIVASVPNVAHWFVRIDLLRGRFRYRDCGIMDATHVRWFTRETLHRFFENLGLQVTDHLYTVNSGMPEYGEARPFKWIPQRYRRRLVRFLVQRFPNLFGCQHVVKVKPISA